MTIEEVKLRELVDALAILQGGWAGEEGGPLHKAFCHASKVVHEHRAELLRKRGICKNCGCNS